MENLKHKLLNHAHSLRELLDMDHEVAGCVEYPIDRKHQFGGTTSNVDIPNCIFTYHTHPKIAYIENGVEMAWPSGEDMAAMVSSPKNLGHAVISVEGIYIMSLTPEMKTKLDRSPKDKEIVADIIQSIFSSSHDFRQRKLMTPYDFVKWANNFTLNSIDGKIPPSGPCTMKSCPSRTVPTPYPDEKWTIDKWLKSQNIPKEKYTKTKSIIGQNTKIVQMLFIPWNSL